MNELNKEVMIDSYRNISFNGEKRGEQDFLYYSELLKSDLETLGENQGNYKEKFVDKVMTIFNRQSLCTSAMIVGPARYNIQRHEKNWSSRDKAEQEFRHWREKYFKAVNRQRTLSPEAEIDKTVEEIERLEFSKSIFQQVDKLKTNEEKFQLLEEEGFLDDMLKRHIELGYKLVRTSLTTKIRERKKKLLIMQKRIERKESFEKLVFNGGYIDIVNDRVIIVHDEKPSREVIEKISSHGFRYSPKMKNWCRKHTGNAIYSVNKFLYPFLKGEVSNANSSTN